jgi:hypothetical protein
MDQIESYDEIIANEDSLQMIYAAPTKDQEQIALQWQKRKEQIALANKELLSDPNKKITTSTNTVDINKNNNTGYTLKQAVKSDFYFDNPQTVNMGSANFIKKWGDRPNVDNWRRKTTIQLVRSNTTNTGIETSNTNIASNTALAVKKDGKKKDSANTLQIQLIQSETELKKSKENWNKQTLAIAKTFLYELNDFEKALPRYIALIQKNIDPIATESALLDLASQYMHIGKAATSDSLIQVITTAFPEGNYVKKKKAKENLDRIDKNSTEAYKETYFMAQIGDWDQFGAQMDAAQKQFKGTKWQTPYQFLKVKMYAQQGLDSMAIVLLNELIAQNKSEPIKAKAKSIITEINNRKATEAYLAALKIVKPTRTVIVEEEATVQSKGPSITVKKDTSLATTHKIETKPSNKTSKDSTALFTIAENQLVFTNDSLEQHYIALQTTNVSAVFVKEIQNALKDVHAEEFRKLNLAVTFVQFAEQSHIVWIGPFVNAAEGLQYLQKVKPRLSTEIISFISKKQYDLTLIGKSNIIQINNQAQMDQYKRDKSNYYFKP